MMCTPAASTRVELVRELAGDLLGVAAQREAALFVGVVGVLDGDVPHGRLGLRLDELGEVLDLEHRAGRVLHPPHHDRRQLDGVAVRVVDLEDVRLVVADAGGDLLAAGQRVDPAQPLGPDRPPVAAEELYDPRLPGGDRVEPAHREERRDGQQDAHRDQGHLERVRAHHRAEEHQAGTAREARQAEQQGRAAADAVRGELPYVTGRTVDPAGCSGHGAPPFVGDARPGSAGASSKVISLFAPTATLGASSASVPVMWVLILTSEMTGIDQG